MSETREWTVRNNLSMTVGVFLIVGAMLLGAWHGPGPIGWLANLGWVLWFLAVGLLAWPIYYLKRHGSVAKGHSFVDTTEVVDTGIYSVIRHPQYLGWLLFALAQVLRAQRLDVTVLVVASMVAVIIDLRKMDDYNIELFGEPYREYMAKVPGWNPFAGLWRLARRKGEA